MFSIKYIYAYIKYIKSKPNTQNCQVENNKMIFAMEKFKSLVAMFSKLHHGLLYIRPYFFHSRGEF